MSIEKENWFVKQYHWLKGEIIPANADDSAVKRAGKSVGFTLFLILMLCTTLTITFALIFVL